jgi:hypothetical protein
MTTDYYDQCETALMTRLRTLTNLFPKDYQVSTDDSVLNRGGDVFAIFQPDAFPQTRVDGRDVSYNWVVIFDLYVRYKSRAESLARFKAARAAIVELLSPFALNGTSNISRCVLAASGSLQQDLPGDNPNFIIQTLTATITQRVRY